MKFLPPVTVEELRALSDKELIIRINNKIAPDGTYFSFTNFAEGQFYIEELDRREKLRADLERDKTEHKRHRVGLLLECLVILLICIEIGVTLEESYAQNNVLAELERNSAATASILTNLQANQANSAMVVSVRYDKASRSFMVTNLGPAQITLTQYHLGHGRGLPTDLVFQNAIPPGLSGGAIPAENITAGTGYEPRSGKTYSSRVELYFHDFRGTKYVADTPVSITSVGDSYDISCGTSTVVQFNSNPVGSKAPSTNP